MKLQPLYKVVLIIILLSIWWVISFLTLGIGNQNSENILLYAFVSFSLCYAVRVFVDWRIKLEAKIYEPVSCSHYLQGCLIFRTYGIIYAIDWNAFVKHWSSIFFGQVLYDNFSLLIFWNDISPEFRRFYSIHHALGLIMTGFWWLPSVAWSRYLTLGVCVWLSSEIWLYAFYVYRHFRGYTQLSRRLMAKVQMLLFLLERLQRIVAYCLLVLLDDVSSLVWILLATVVAADLLDVFYQIKALRQVYQSLKLA